MALPAATVWEVRTTGSDNNGGGFVNGASGTDYSQQDSAQVTIDGSTISAVVGSTTTHLTLTGHTPVSAEVGNLVHITGGTATAGFYEIVSISGSDWVLDRSCGTAAQTATGAMGGGLANPATAIAAVVAGNTVFIQTGTYSTGTATITVPNGANGNPVTISGYGATHGDGGQATLQFTSNPGAAAYILTCGTYTDVWNLVYDGQTFSNSRGVTDAGYNNHFNCVYKNMGTYGATVGLGNVMNCRATNNASYGFNVTGSGVFVNCISDNNAGHGFYGTNVTAVLVRCVSYNNSGATTDGFYQSSTANGMKLINCVGYGNGRHGANYQDNASASIHNCVFVKNTGWGLYMNTNYANITPTSQPTWFADYNAYGSGTMANGLGAANNIQTGPHAVTTLSADPFTNAAGLDFSLNNSNPGGAQLRAAGFPGSSPLGTGYLDIGALQHQDTGTSSGSQIQSRVLLGM